MKKEVELKGVPIVPGKAVGRAFFIGGTVDIVEKKHISKEQVGEEIILFNKIRQRAKIIYRDYGSQAQKSDDLSWDTSILDVYIHILDDPAFVGEVVQTVTTHLVALETAIKLVSNDFIKRFDSAQTSYFKERGSDMVEICEKLVSLINGKEGKEQFNEQVILIIPRTFIPSDLLSYELSMIKGVVALNAGTTSHAVILARTYEIPVISGVKNTKRFLKNNMQVFLDAGQGIVYANPEKSRLDVFQSYHVIYESIRRLSKKWHKPVYTKDGIHIKVDANVSLPDDAEHAHQYGADSIGLVRSEYLYYMHDRIPSEKDQLDYFEAIFNKAGDMHVTIRLLDIGADKIPNIVEFPKETNPSLGWRGIRILLNRKELFRNHVSSILKAAKGRDYSIMIPMVSTLWEWREAKNFIMKVAKDLKQPLPKCGVLFEVPLALLEIENYLNEVDFLSIGTNDLIQYLLAADRNNPNVNYLYNPIEPAFLQLLKKTIHASKAKGKEVSICGEMAGSPLYTILLIGLGLTRFSVSSHNIPAIKEIISFTSFSKTQEQISHLLSMANPEEMNECIIKMIKNTLGSAYKDLKYLFDTRGLSLFCKG